MSINPRDLLRPPGVSFDALEEQFLYMGSLGLSWGWMIHPDRSRAERVVLMVAREAAPMLDVTGTRESRDFLKLYGPTVWQVIDRFRMEREKEDGRDKHTAVHWNL